MRDEVHRGVAQLRTRFGRALARMAEREGVSEFVRQDFGKQDRVRENTIEAVVDDNVSLGNSDEPLSVDHR